MLSDVSDLPTSVQVLANGLSRQLDYFKTTWQLTAGLSMDSLWTLLRPKTPPTLKQLHTVLHLEKLADKFDALIWRVGMPLARLSEIRQSISDAIRVVLSEDVPGDGLANVGFPFSLLGVGANLSSRFWKAQSLA